MNSNKSIISCKRGFTLFQLLVVVLIIGILAAVALPQYKMAVVKSRVATILPILATLQKAEGAHYLANGSYTLHIQELDVDIPCTESRREEDDMPFWKCGNDFLVQAGSPGVFANYCPNHNNSFEECDSYRDFQIAYNHLYSNSKGNHYCVIKNNSELGTAVCKNMGTQTANPNNYLMP